jgi:predicted nucleic acid-binding protein
VIVVSDTSPLNYLVQLSLVDLLEELYGTIYVPESVVAELRHSGSPQSVCAWAMNLPEWLVSRPAPETIPDAVLALDPGERDAIALAVELRANAVLADDLKARQAAMAIGLPVTGTLGVLAAGVDIGKVDFEAALADLLRLGFRASQQTIAIVRASLR